MVSQVFFLFLSGRECKVLWPGLAFGVGDPHRLPENELTQTLLQCILAEFDFLLHHCLSYQDSLRSCFFLLFRPLQQSVL